MLAMERREKIIQIITSQGSIRAAELAKIMDVSMETIRKDLTFLNNAGLIEKQFGGATAVNEFIEQPLDIRSMENYELKQKIAKRALEFIEDNKVVFIDAGSTLLAFAELLPKEKNLALVTNSFKAVEILAKTSNVIFFLGGEVSNITMATSGFWTTTALNTLKIDIAFLGTSGFQSHSGPCAKMFSDAQFKMEIIKNSRHHVILADSTKFHSNAIVQYANWSDIDALITDSAAPENQVNAIRNSTDVILV